jgi:lipoprotein
MKIIYYILFLLFVSCRADYDFKYNPKSRFGREVDYLRFIKGSPKSLFYAGHINEKKYVKLAYKYPRELYTLAGDIDIFYSEEEDKKLRDEYRKGKTEIKGKLSFEREAPFRAAILVVVDSTHCVGVFGDDREGFEILIDTTKIQPTSFMEFVAKGYPLKRIYLKDFLKSDRTVEMKKGKNPITTQEWSSFVININTCNMYYW